MNYGWPKTCPETPNIRCYTDFTLAPAGVAIIGNRLFVGGLRGNQLRIVDLGGTDDQVRLTDLGRIREVVEHEGMLYISTSNRDGRGSPADNDDRIFRIDPSRL